MYITPPHTHTIAPGFIHLLCYHTLIKVFCCFATQTNTFLLNAHKKPYFIFHNHVDYDIDRPRSVKAL